ncbi:hypothetical protein FHX76_002932 [Lysinibacter cavernae]|uniref:Uncharacterized protein n=1 Tax=Lysinibacter cavernae TaxID=1640652 RepID=A0A7X5R3S0_9MICO|nr:hypothetical protein [Lysinibacter cavernae]
MPDHLSLLLLGISLPSATILLNGAIRIFIILVALYTHDGKRRKTALQILDRTTRKKNAPTRTDAAKPEYAALAFAPPPPPHRHPTECARQSNRLKA